MRIVTTGAKELLFNRLQCIRDVLSELDDTIDDIIERKTDCCTPSSSESSSSSSEEIIPYCVQLPFTGDPNNQVRLTQIDALTPPTIIVSQGGFSPMHNIIVAGRNITIYVAQNFGFSYSTANQLIAAINAHPDASLIIEASLNSGDGTASLGAFSYFGPTQMFECDAEVSSSSGELSPMLWSTNTEVDWSNNEPVEWSASS
jgi:hypothetical protein